MIDASVDGMFAFDRECRFIAWNRAMERISGHSRDEVLGKRVVDVFPFLSEPAGGSCFSSPLQGQESVSENHPYGPSETGLFESHYSPLLDEKTTLPVLSRSLLTSLPANRPKRPLMPHIANSHFT